VLSGENTLVVSGIHALIDLKPDGAFLVDLESANGTFVNERRIDGPTRLEVGHSVRLGQTGPCVQVTGIELPRPPRSERPAAPLLPPALRWGGPAVALVALVVFVTATLSILARQQQTL